MDKLNRLKELAPSNFPSIVGTRSLTAGLMHQKFFMIARRSRKTETISISISKKHLKMGSILDF
jgi:hypothetical protein